MIGLAATKTASIFGIPPPFIEMLVIRSNQKHDQQVNTGRKEEKRIISDSKEEQPERTKLTKGVKRRRSLG